MNSTMTTTHLVKLPPVLVIQLNRFEQKGDDIEKIHERHTFEEKLCLTEYLKGSDVPADFTLHSVITHSGNTTSSGHYICFVNTDGAGKWWKFDDIHVTKSNKEDAINGNYGGLVGDKSAFVLIYTRDMDVAWIRDESDRQLEKQVDILYKIINLIARIYFFHFFPIKSHSATIKLTFRQKNNLFDEGFEIEFPSDTKFAQICLIFADVGGLLCSQQI